MNKDIQYINLIRKLRRAERRLHDVVPINLMDITWEETEDKLSDLPYEPTFEDMLPTEMQKIEWRRVRKERQDVYFEIFDFYNNDSDKIMAWFKEYHDLEINDGSYKSDAMFDKNNKIPFLKPKNPIGEMTWGGEDGSVVKDKFSVVFGFLSHEPIDKFNKRKVYRVQVNDKETTMTYNQYSFMQYICQSKHRTEKFHPMDLLCALEFEKLIDNGYSGRLQDLFKTRSELMPILFKEIKSPKGYWICQVKHWFGE